jgi:hypothetical protein
MRRAWCDDAPGADDDTLCSSEDDEEPAGRKTVTTWTMSENDDDFAASFPGHTSDAAQSVPGTATTDGNWH